ncbi:hypothetical protein D6117_002279 [Lactococcus lactis]|uniref:hypothetical protein n=1 Tax=Lactococcus lactis TaxID=1358 RepID=UPI000F546E6B|nr:hypothetical protein [Lactococcus lactis]RQE00506.1 hypothetical protein D6109_06445 [Lactococcus lactis]RQE04524.1 hypothetical protein D6107_04015 [Lactococcus lactis]RQE07335.1 hypothetical protein D6110_06140 [Lactococcus lactis]RQE11127.1 hypothetical protein D6108_03615 [Lactococcus lactis]RQE13160.1 hypothetical protein D6113_06825 [Lactococcus lactis]
MPVNFKHSTSCPSCKNIISIPLSTNDFLSDYDNTRPMGTEYQYTVTDYPATCPKCKNNFVLNGNIFEYPEGQIEISDLIAE